jgi:multidrug efflux pump subunit AcrA (membrane-fusion protein)
MVARRVWANLTLVIILLAGCGGKGGPVGPATFDPKNERNALLWLVDRARPAVEAPPTIRPRSTRVRSRFGGP